MHNSYTQLHFEFIFAVRYRDGVIRPAWQDRLHRYVTDIVENNGHRMLQINSMPDHVHMLVSFGPHQSMAALMRNVKTQTSKFIKTVQSGEDRPFAWQTGYGAVSHSKSSVENVIRYIRDQEKHHRKQTFLDEYRALLESSGLEWNERHMFRALE